MGQAFRFCTPHLPSVDIGRVLGEALAEALVEELLVVLVEELLVVLVLEVLEAGVFVHCPNSELHPVPQ